MVDHDRARAMTGLAAAGSIRWSMTSLDWWRNATPAVGPDWHAE